MPNATTVPDGGISLTIDGPVATVTLDRPPRNAQVPSTWSALAALPERLSDDVRVVVLRANGPHFSAGLDLGLFQPGAVPGEPTAADLANDPDLDARIAGFQRGFSWWGAHPAISIAVVHGHGVGAGFQLALATDLRVLDASAVLTMREVTLGLVPDLGGTQRLTRLVGPSAALDLVATGRTVAATEAARLGLADRLVEPEALEAEVNVLVESLLAVPPAALFAAKRLIQGAVDRTTEAQLAAERTEQVPLLRGLVARSPSA